MTASATPPLEPISDKLFAALMGAHLLREGDVMRRAIAAVGMVLGIAGLALG